MSEQIVIGIVTPRLGSVAIYLSKSYASTAIRLSRQIVATERILLTCVRLLPELKLADWNGQTHL